VSTISNFLVSITHIKHYAFSTVHYTKFPSVHCTHQTLHISYCPLYQIISNTIMSKVRTLHFSYAKMSKLRPHSKCPPYQMTTHFLCKNVKNASLIGMSTISKSLHFSYTNMPKLRPPNTTLHFPYQNKPKLRTPNVHYINHYTFTIQTSQNCVHQINHYTFTMQKRSFGGF
jgi:hypothetical protein